MQKIKKLPQKCNTCIMQNYSAKMQNYANA